MGSPSCSASNYFAVAGFEDNFSKKQFLYLLYTQKNFILAASFDINATWSEQKLKKGCIPKLKWLENVKLQSAASKRYSCPLSIHHPSNIEWTILWTVRLIETREEMYCTFKHKGQSWLQILEVKLKKQRYQLIHERELFVCAVLNKYLLRHCLNGR